MLLPLLEVEMLVYIVRNMIFYDLKKKQDIWRPEPNFALKGGSEIFTNP